jgi:hypothetical protein
MQGWPYESCWQTPPSSAPCRWDMISSHAHVEMLCHSASGSKSVMVAPILTMNGTVRLKFNPATINNNLPVQGAKLR